MKYLLILFFVTLTLSCKTEPMNPPEVVKKSAEVVTQPTVIVEKSVEKVEPKVAATSAPFGKQIEKAKTFPEALVKIFEAHGGLDLWNSMESLTYMHTQKGVEIVTTTELGSRKTVSEMPNHTLGYDGKDVWLNKKNKTKYKKDPKFMYNLMFYFHAMPFVLADDGIIYSEAKALEFGGKTYPGIGISYEDGIGESAKDEYVIYYNPESYKMEWLSYTMTFFSKEKSKELRFRHYKDWQKVDGLLRPTKIIRYKTAKNLPTKIYSASTFENIKFSTEKPERSLFEIPEGAEIVK